MKRLLLFFLFIFHFVYATGQERTITGDLSYSIPEGATVINCKPLKYDSQKKANNYLLEIIDCRPDTTKIGYQIKKGNWSKLCIEKDYLHTVNKYLNQSSNADNGKEKIYMFLKNLWVYNSIGSNSKIWIKAEFYLKSNECFYPLYRFDSLFTEMPIVKNDDEDLLFKCLENSTTKLSLSLLDNVYSKKCLSSSQIDSFNYKKKSFPVFNIQKLSKGVFLTFDEFKQNKPSYVEFTNDFSSAQDMIFVKGKNNDDSTITDAWGFSKGDTVYIRYSKNYFPLIRTGYGYEFFGFGEITAKYEKEIFFLHLREFENAINRYILNANTPVVVPKKFYTKEMEIFVLDMDTGKVF
jgi:hypothetical protein